MAIKYDAIVVGSGISGGWAAKELCENGLNVLMLERGGPYEHIKDYKTAMKNPWEFAHGGHTTREQREQKPIIHRTGFANGRGHGHEGTGLVAAGWTMPGSCWFWPGA